MKSALKFASWMLLACSLVGTSQAQEEVSEERRDIITDARMPLPLPMEGGSRWLRYALLSPAHKQLISPVQQRQPDVSGEVRELREAQRRIGGSLVKGPLFDGVGGSTEAEQQRIFQRMAQEARTADSALTDQIVGQIAQQPVTRVANESGPFTLLQSYSQPADPTHVAIAQLRMSARNLDQAAADLEDAGKYGEADRIRASANRLRREAREFASEQQEQPNR